MPSVRRASSDKAPVIRPAATSHPAPSSGSLQVGAIVLAAGKGRRMGSGTANKLLARVGDKSVIRHVLDRVVGCHTIADSGHGGHLLPPLFPVFVVVPSQAPALLAEVAAYPHVKPLVNSRAHEGMSTSLRLGIEALPAGTEAAFVLLGDQPLFPHRVLEELFAAYAQTSSADGVVDRNKETLIAAPVYDGQRGHPVLFSAQLFPELLKAEGDQGGRHLFSRYRTRTRLIHYTDRIGGVDVDTPEDLERLREAYSRIHSRT